MRSARAAGGDVGPDPCLGPGPHRSRIHGEAAGTLSGSARGNDIRAVVQKFLPAGTSLGRAEELLRQAGFDVEPGDPIPAGGQETTRTIRARSGTIVRSTVFGTSDEIVVEPDADGTSADSKVRSIPAHIYVTSL